MSIADYERIKQEAYDANMQLPKLGLVLFTFGNVSVADHALKVFAIKPSGVPYDELSPDKMVIVDFNGLQSIKTTNETLNLHPFVEKWSSFCWDVVEVNGHNPREIAEAISTRESADRPLCVVARTVKGRGVSFMENNVLWHYRTARGAEFDSALLELEG